MTLHPRVIQGHLVSGHLAADGRRLNVVNDKQGPKLLLVTKENIRDIYRLVRTLSIVDLPASHKLPGRDVCRLDDLQSTR